MRRVNGLKVIENPYCYVGWETVRTEAGQCFHSQKKTFCQRRDTELYRLCGVYHRAGVPAEIEEVDGGGAEEEFCLRVTRNLSDSVYRGVKAGKAVLIAGGYCNYAPAAAGGLQRAVGTEKRIGAVWIDAHTDNQIAETRDSLRLVALPVSTMTGQTMEQYRKTVCGLERPVKGENILLSDARETEEEEEENLKAAGCQVLRWKDFEDEMVWKEAVMELAGRTDTIYLSVDADILQSQYVPAYEREIPGGHSIDVVMRNISAVMATGKVNVFSVFCVDFDHYDRQGEYTYLSGMKLIASGLAGWTQSGL